MLKTLKIISTTLLSLLIILYSFLVIFGIFGLFCLPIIYMIMGRGYFDFAAMFWGSIFIIFLFVGLFGLVSCFLILDNPNINIIYRVPLYLFLPLSIPYWLVDKKIKNMESEFYILYDSSFLKTFLIVTSTMNYLIFLFPLFASFMTLLTTNPGFWVSYLVLPITLISFSIVIGTSANIYNYSRPNKIASALSYGAFNVIFIFKSHQKRLIKNKINLYPRHQQGNDALGGSRYLD